MSLVAFQVTHVAQRGDDAAGRAGQRAHLAARAAGLRSNFAVLQGGGEDAILLRRDSAPDPLGDALGRAIARAAPAGLSFAYPALAFDRHPLFLAADIIHLHGALPGLAPAAVRGWLDAGKRVVWSLHDFWPLTGGCHRPGACEQWRSACMACPIFDDAWSLVPNAFDEKRAAYDDPRLTVIAPTRWMEARVRASAILRRTDIRHLPDALDTAIFTVRADRDALRAGFGFAPDDRVLLLGAGGAPVLAALRSVAPPAGGRIVLILLGDDAVATEIPGVTVLRFGTIADPAIRADFFGSADLACFPGEGQEEQVLEAFGCGTPCMTAEGGAAAELAADAGLAHASNIAAIADALHRFLAAPRTTRRADTAAHIHAAHGLETVGRRLAALYAEGMAPRVGTATDPALAARIARALGAAPVGAGGPPDAAFLRFPFNHLLASEAHGAAQGATLDIAPPPARRVLAVRSRHAHHAAPSGPYHFLRHLPPEWEADSWTVPLGSALAPQWVNRYAALGRLMGAKTFGHNVNSWVAEAEILARCAAAPAEIVHFIDGEHGGALLPRLAAALFPDGQRPRWIATYHQPPALLRGIISRETLRTLDAVIVLCDSMRQALAPLVAPDRLFILPHGIDTDFFTPAPERAADGTLRLIAVGHWLRDYPAALAALAALRARGTDARLTIVWKDFLGQPPPGVTIRHGLSDAELRQAYRDADALFLPLTDATANNAILEAMACGRPIISTDVGGVQETVGDAALLAPPGDVATLAEALEIFAGDPARRRALGQAARARAEALAWPRIAARQAEIYARVLALPSMTGADRLEVHGGPSRASATLAAGWPRGLNLPARPASRAVAPAQAEVARLLDAGDIETLLALLGEALLAGADRAGIAAACHPLLHHLARHPLRREPALGALVAALAA